MSTQTIPKFRVAIIGAGIGGLVLGIALGKGHKDIAIDIYEGAHQLNEIGAGVGMWLRPFLAMKALGLKESMNQHLEEVPSEDTQSLAFEMRKSDQHQGAHIGQLNVPFGNLFLKRSDFQIYLEGQLGPSVQIHFSKRLQSYDDPKTSFSPIELKFADGTSANCDILIGADGIHSVTRHQMFHDAAAEINSPDIVNSLMSTIDSMWTGTVAYRAVVPAQRLRELQPDHRVLTKPMNYIGTDKHAIIFPMHHHELINIVVFCSEPNAEGTVYPHSAIMPATKRELLDQFVGWEPEFVQVLELIENPSKWVISSLKGIPTYTHGRVALLGDAAHATTPHQGSGAGQAIEDAYVLGALLSHPLTTLETLPIALKIYEEIRLPRGNDVIVRSRRNGQLFEFSHSDFHDLRNTKIDENDSDAQARLQNLMVAVEDNWKWAWITTPVDDVEASLELLQKRVNEAAAELSGK